MTVRPNGRSSGLIPAVCPALSRAAQQHGGQGSQQIEQGGGKHGTDGTVRASFQTVQTAGSRANRRTE